MPWDETRYPVSMKNLAPEVRIKAIEIANALLDEGYDEGAASKGLTFSLRSESQPSSARAPSAPVW